MTESGDNDEREAFTLAYRLHSPAVFRFALHMTGDKARAGDITQDVFVWLMRHSGSFDPARGELGAFLIGVTRKFILRLQRSERKWLPFTGEQAAGGSWAHEDRGSQAAALREAIAALPVRYREVVVLCDLEGESYEAAAAAIECAVGTVRSRLHRARELLARKLQAKGVARSSPERCGV